ncbi:unnamed protein product [Peronospora farinosa]|nr:unnamed protein product [Peronospora farinosa]
MAYRPQANGTAERMLQTLTRSLKMYVADVGQRDWDEYAERLTFALNTAQDRVREETPFYLSHYQRERDQVNENLRAASQARVQAQNEGVVGHEIQPGARVWLYLDRVKEGYAKKLAHLWHGSFRVQELVGDHAVRLELREGEYEVEEILESRTGKKTRYGRQQREFLVQWKGNPDPSWVDEVDLNCGALLRDFERKKTSHNRFEVMQSHEN